MIEDDLYRELIAGQSGTRMIDFSVHPPMLIDRPPMPTEYFETLERDWRNARLLATDPIVARHRDERDMGAATTLTAAQFTELMQYREALRNWPGDEVFPSPAGRPVAPDWLTV